MGMLRPASGTLTATHTQAATGAMASHVTHHNRATSSSPSQAVVLWCTLKKTHQCFAKYTIVLEIWLACCAVERKNPQTQQSPSMAWVHSGSGGGASLITNAPEQCWHPLHFKNRDRNINLFTLREKKEHCQHVFTVFTWKGKKKTKTTTNNYKQSILQKTSALMK